MTARLPTDYVKIFWSAPDNAWIVKYDSKCFIGPFYEKFSKQTHAIECARTIASRYDLPFIS